MKYIASTIVRASDIGLNDNLFGGTLLRWLDEYGALFTYKYLHHTFVTYKMEKTYFLKPAKQGDCIDFYVTNIKFSPISVNFDLVAKNNGVNPAIEIINTNMTFVAIDIINEKKQYINPFLFEQDEFELYMKQKAFSKISNDENIFHNQNHIEDMLTQLNMYKTSIPVIEYKRLFAAICYHDICHNYLCDEDKDDSYKVFERDWKKFISKEDLNGVYEYITATEYDITPAEIGDNKYSHLIHDLNMISFIDYETMKNSDIRLKSEFSRLSPKEFYETRLKYFKYLLKENVFISSKYKKYNTIAAENINQYISEIKPLLAEIKEN